MTSSDHLVSETPQSTRADFTIDQNWEAYTDEEHDVWRTLFERQSKVIKDRACQEFIDGVEALDMCAGGIPDFRKLNKHLEKLTGWNVVAVPGFVEDEIFFEHLANKRFPCGRFIRRREQLDYLQEPDIFHDVYGHVPLLTNQMFADYLVAYGKGGLRAMGRNILHKLARLYWYTVEFGLIKTDDGLRAFGAGMLSSSGETVFCLEDPSPNRIMFDLYRLLRTNYRIDDYQEVYFVIESFEQLFEDTLQDFGPVYDRLETMSDLEPFDILEDDVVLHRGTGAYAMAQKAKAG